MRVLRRRVFRANLTLAGLALAMATPIGCSRNDEAAQAPAPAEDAHSPRDVDQEALRNFEEMARGMAAALGGAAPAQEPGAAPGTGET